MDALLLAVFFVPLAACAGQQPTPDATPVAAEMDRVYSAAQVDLEPVLLGCPHNPPVEATFGRGMKVSVRYVVSVEGTVEPGSVVVENRHHDTDDRTLIERAKQIALGCSYEPGQIAGEAVRVAVRERFVFGESR